MNKILKKLLIILAALAFGWLLLTFWVEAKGPAVVVNLGLSNAEHKALIVYDPDPFYNLDEQVCLSFGKALTEAGWFASIATVRSAEFMPPAEYDLYVFCANTYNFFPDWAITGFIKDGAWQNKNVAAITLGAGSTSYAKENFERLIKTQKANLLNSRTFWLWRPNNESRMNESNIEVARDMASKWAKQMATDIK